MFNIPKFTNPRYSFKKVFLVILAINIALLIISIVVMFSTATAAKPFDWSHHLSVSYLVREVTGIICVSIHFYFFLNYFNQLIISKKGAMHYVAPVAISLIIVLLYNFTTYYAFKPRVDEEVEKQITPGLLAFGFTISGLFVTACCLLIAWFNNLRDEKKEREILEQQKMTLEVEKSQANLNFLKAQINPHFLHNTLNFLYAKALPLSDELSEGILTLSDIMRYALSDGNTKNGKALLKEEIEHVQNVIKINQLRFSNNLQVNFSVEGVINGARIIPFVLITLVENAFKHGDLKSSDQPIVIRIIVANGGLSFYCSNKKKTGSKELSTGLGLDNIKKRLDLAYGSNYRFKILDEMDTYTAELMIDEL